MTTKLHVWNLSLEQAAELTLDARVAFLSEAANQFHSQETRNTGIADGIMRILQSCTLKESKTALKAAEKAYKEKHDTPRMPGSWRTIKATCLAVKEEKEPEFNSAESYHAIKGLYKEVTKGRREAKAQKVREAADKAATMNEEQLQGLSPKDLLDAVNAGRRDVLERVGALPNAYQMMLWASEELSELIASYERQFEEAKGAIEGTSDAAQDTQEANAA